MCLDFFLFCYNEHGTDIIKSWLKFYFSILMSTKESEWPNTAAIPFKDVGMIFCYVIIVFQQLYIDFLTMVVLSWLPSVL